MANKKTLQRLRLDPYFSKTIATNLNVWSHDINSYEIKFEFYDSQCDKPIDLTGADMRILLDHQGSQPKVYPLEIESKILGLAKFIMPPEIRGCEGKFTAHIYADYPNKTHDFGSFIFYTKLSRLDGDLGGCMDEIYVSEFEKALEDIKEFKAEIDKNISDMGKDFDDKYNEAKTKISEVESLIKENEVAKNKDFIKVENDIYKGGISKRNLIVSNEVTPKLWINNDGSETYRFEEAFTTGFIKVANGEKYVTTQKHLDLISVMVVSGYDKEKKFVKRIALCNNKYCVFEIDDDNISFIRYSGKSPTGHYEEGIKVEYGEKPTTWSFAPEDLIYLSGKVSSNKSDVSASLNKPKIITEDIKALIKKDENRYDVITQKGNNYIEMVLRKDVIDTSDVSLGGEGQVFRLTEVKELSEAFAYIQPKFTSSSKDGVDDFFVGKLDTGYNYPAKANYITNTGRENWNSYLKFKHKIKTTDNGKLGLAFYSTKNTNQELSVYVNDVKVDTIDTSTGEAGSPVVIYTVNVGKEIGNVEIKLQVPNSAAASKSVHFLGIGVKEFNTLEPNSEYNGILYNYSGNNYITKSKGANDYALKNAEGKWMGSYHGGEVIENQLITVDSKKETLAKDEVAFGNDISFYQKTNIDNTIKNNFVINFSKPATIEHQNNFKVDKPFITKDFYVAMTCTNPEFNTVVSPDFFKTTTGKTVFIDNIGEVIQIDEDKGLSITSNHSILKDYATKPLYIQSSEYYNKVYHSATTNKDYEVNDIYFSSSKVFN